MIKIPQTECFVRRDAMLEDMRLQPANDGIRNRDHMSLENLVGAVLRDSTPSAITSGFGGDHREFRVNLPG